MKERIARLEGPNEMVCHYYRSQIELTSREMQERRAEKRVANRDQINSLKQIIAQLKTEITESSDELREQCREKRISEEIPQRPEMIRDEEEVQLAEFEKTIQRKEELLTQLNSESTILVPSSPAIGSPGK
jgi:hypothetical protein